MINIHKIITALKWRFYLPFELIQWYTSDRKGIAPHYLKQRTVINYRKKYNCKIFIETGTFLGDMINAVKNKFDTIHSIELNTEYAKAAMIRFQNQKHIKIWQGDSGVELQKVLNETNGNILFWLDGHCCVYQGAITSRSKEDTPILSEISVILNHIKKNGYKHVILIDDSRLFIGKDGYPTLESLVKLVKNELTSHQILVKNDIIAIY